MEAGANEQRNATMWTRLLKLPVVALLRTECRVEAGEPSGDHCCHQADDNGLNKGGYRRVDGRHPSCTYSACRVNRNCRQIGWEVQEKKGHEDVCSMFGEQQEEWQSKRLRWERLRFHGCGKEEDQQFSLDVLSRNCWLDSLCANEMTVFGH